ncbi:MAG: hypothetical protein BRC36_00330 [Cyanobacteria bacterium QH_2_48_84]|nr:MAG: hypothetical protein BRC36_00330 [Cyanobacteria bacterium QH_2_48_84]
MTNAEKRRREATLNKLTSNGERIAVVENKLDATQSEISEVKQNVSGLKQDVSELKVNVSSLDARFSSIEFTLGWVKWIGVGILTVLSMMGIGLATNAVWAYIL